MEVVMGVVLGLAFGFYAGYLLCAYHNEGGVRFRNRYAFVPGRAPSRLLSVMHRPTQTIVRARGRPEAEVRRR